MSVLHGGQYPPVQRMRQTQPVCIALLLLSATCASSRAWCCRPAISTSETLANYLLAGVTVNVAPPLLSLLSGTRQCPGQRRASLRFGDQGQNLTAINVQSAVVSSSCGSHRTSGSSKRHGSFEMQPVSVDLRPSHKTWRYEQWVHLKFASRKRRKDRSPSGTKSSRHW